MPTLGKEDLKTRELLTNLEREGAEDPEKSFVEADKPDFEGERKTVIENIERGEFADMVAKGLIKMLAGVRGEATGLDLSKVETEGPDWERRLKSRLQGIGAKESAFEKEAARKERRVEGMKKRDFDLDLATWSRMNKEAKAERGKITTERQRLNNILKASQSKEKELKTLVAQIGGEDDEKKAEALAKMEIEGIEDPEIVASIKEGDIPITALAGSVDAIRAKRAITEGVLELYGDLEASGRSINPAQEKRIRQFSKLPARQLSNDVPVGKVVYSPTPVEVYKAMKAEMKEEEKKTDWYEFDTDRLNELEALMDEWKENPVAASKKYTEQQRPKKSKMIKNLGQLIDAAKSGQDVSGYKIGVKNLGSVLKATKGRK